MWQDIRVQDWPQAMWYVFVHSLNLLVYPFEQAVSKFSAGRRRKRRLNRSAKCAQQKKFFHALWAMAHVVENTDGVMTL
jgi:hypothetical protein